jgi:gliding motility-associated-like protein
MKKLYTLLFFFSLLLVTDAIAQTIRYVKAGATGNGASWANASGDLQAMINASAANDQVWVAAGTYYPTELAAATLATGTPPAPTTDRDKSFIIKGGVKIYGGFNGTETALTARNYTANITILSGDLGVIGDKSDNAYHVVGTRNSVTAGCTLDGFTIQDGYANGEGSVNFSGTLSIPQNCGAAIASRGTTTAVEYTNLIIKNNEATDYAGAVYLYISGTGSYKFTNVQFIGNKSGGTTYGAGAVYLYSSSGTPTVVFSNNTFKGNSSVAAGGAIYARSSTHSVVIENSTFENNTVANAAGGAIYSVLTGNLNITGSTFLNNKSLTANAGAIYLGTNTKDCIIENTSFEGNEAATSAGAIYFSSNSTTLKSNKFYRNKATSSGGALFIYSLSASSVSSPILVNNIFYNNSSLYTSASATALAGGGAVFVSSNTAPTIINSTFYGNSATYKGGAVVAGYGTSLVKIYNSIVYANTAAIDGPDLINLAAGTNLEVKHTITQQYGQDGVNGNMVGINPEFDSEDVNNPDFLQLQQISQAVNAGENTFVPTTITTDILGNNRIAHGVVDLGAIEYNGPLADPLKVYIDENSPQGTRVASPTTNLTGTITWAIIAGNSNDAFAINPTTGVIVVNNSAAIDYETKKLFSLRLKPVNNLNEDENVYVQVYINNLMEDPGTPAVANVVNGVLTSYRPKLSGLGEPLSTVTIYVDGVAYPTTTTTNARGVWNFNFVEELRAGLRSFYVVTSEPTLGTSNPSGKVSVTLKLYSGQLTPNNILTPNGDGKNDLWVVENLTLMYPKNEVIVYNKVGKVVFRKNNYQNDWDGTYNGGVLDTGSYYYEINIGAGLKPIKGTITIIKGR